MNNGPFLFLGLFVAMAASWVTFILGPVVQLGNLQSTMTVEPLPAVYPNNAPGLARQGAEVYRANGCAYCHTEQVRPRELGSDIAHGWGVRRSVAHDYVFDQTVLLGTQRIGPDLANAGLRMDATAVLLRLYDPRLANINLDAAHSLMPTYRYLFDVRKIGRVPSTNALVVPPAYATPGYEIVPRPGALALAAYVANLRQGPYLFEAPPPPGTMVMTNAPTSGTNAPAAAGTNSPNPQSAIPNPQSSNAPAK